MILYQEQLSQQRCIIDTTTKNKSFIKMAMLLKKLGIKNYNFMLVLTQVELQGVDPHSKTLSKEMESRVALESKINPWYFFREVIRISSQGGDPVRYILTRANLAIIWLFMNNQDAFITFPRQVGKTISVLSLTTYCLYVMGKNTNMAMFAKDNTLRAENVSRIKDLRNGLPPYMFQTGSRHNNDNQETVLYKPHNNKYLTFVAQSDLLGASKQGRGHSYIWTHWDELAFYNHAQASFESAISAADTAREQAEAAGVPCATLITTTAGFTSNRDGKYAYNLMAGGLQFTESLYDCKDVTELRKLIDVGSTNGFVYVGFSYKQLGKSAEWFKKVTKNKSPEIIATDYLNKWIHGTGQSIIPKHLIEKLEAGIEDPISTTIEDSMVLRWFAEQSTLNSPEFKNIPFIISSDTSDNVGLDFTTLVMINPRDMAMVMSCRCNQTNMVQVAKTIFKLMSRFENCVFIPERNRAATLLDILIHMIESNTNWKVFERIYNGYTQDKGDTVDFRKLDTRLGTVRKQFGFKTTSSKDSRSFLYSTVLMDVIDRNSDRIFDKVIVEEICGLVMRNGRVDHALSGNDDTLIAYLIGCWFIMYGKNLHLYGIDPSDILIKGNLDEEGDTASTSEIIARIKYLEEKLDKNMISGMMQRAFTNELRDLKAMCSEDDYIEEDIFSINQVENKPANKIEAPTPASMGTFMNSLFM